MKNQKNKPMSCERRNMYTVADSLKQHGAELGKQNLKKFIYSILETKNVL